MARRRPPGTRSRPRREPTREELLALLIEDYDYSQATAEEYRKLRIEVGIGRAEIGSLPPIMSAGLRAIKQRQGASRRPKRKPLTWDRVCELVAQKPTVTAAEAWEVFPRLRDVANDTDVTVYREGPGCEPGDPRTAADEVERRRWLKEQRLTEIADQTGKPRRLLTFQAFRRYLTDAKKKLRAAQ